MKSKNPTVWIPVEYREGTIIYDSLNRPWEAIRHLPLPVNVYEVRMVSTEYALAQIQCGAKVLTSGT